MSEISERMEQLMRNVQEQAAKADELQSAVENVRGTATSADRSVTVTAASSGAVLDLQLDAQAARQSHVVLQKTILSTIREATRNAAEQLDEVAEPLLGDQFGQFQHLMKAGTGHVATPGEDAKTAPPPRFQADGTGDDDFQDQTYLR